MPFLPHFFQHHWKKYHCRQELHQSPQGKLGKEWRWPEDQKVTHSLGCSPYSATNQIYLVAFFIKFLYVYTFLHRVNSMEHLSKNYTYVCGKDKFSTKKQDGQTKCQTFNQTLDNVV